MKSLIYEVTFISYLWQIIMISIIICSNKLIIGQSTTTLSKYLEESKHLLSLKNNRKANIFKIPYWKRYILAKLCKMYHLNEKECAHSLLLTCIVCRIYVWLFVRNMKNRLIYIVVNSNPKGARLPKHYKRSKTRSRDCYSKMLSWSW